MRISDNAELAGIVLEVAGVVGRKKPSAASAGVGQGRFAGSGIAAQQQSAPVPADARGMDGSGIGGGDKDESNCLEEVVSDVAGMTNCVFREPGEGKASVEIANRLVVGIGNHGKQVLLAAD